MKRTIRLDQLMVPAALVTALGISYWTGRGSAVGSSVVLMGLLFIVFVSVAALMEGEDDPWLSRLVAMAFAAKIAASTARWAVAEYVYGTGDSFSYHRAGVRFAEAWRTFQIPEITGRSMGTRFVENVTAFLYAPHTPHILGGFFLFATIAFAGQMFYYAAFRHAFGGRQLLPYGIAVFFLPTLLFWPSSIGKDALMTFALGLSAYATARLLDAFQFRWLAAVGVGLWMAAVLRSHVAALIGGALMAAVIVGRARRPGFGAGMRKLVVLAIAALGAVAVLTLFAETFRLGSSGDGLFSIDLSLEDLDPVVSDIERRTGQGGSAVAGGGGLLSPSTLLAFPRVMFAPFPWQAHNALALFSSAEGMAVLAVFLWSLPSIIRSVPHMRRNPYLLLSVAYVMGFSIAFSTILNLGIMSRQRGQVMGLFLAMCFGARALTETETEPEEARPESVTMV